VTYNTSWSGPTRAWFYSGVPPPAAASAETREGSRSRTTRWSVVSPPRTLGQSSAAATDDARRVSWAVSAVVRSRDGCASGGRPATMACSLEPEVPPPWSRPRTRSRAPLATPATLAVLGPTPSPTTCARPRGLLH
jgi:hypothetical protein